LAEALRRAHGEVYREGEYVGQESFMSADEVLALARASGVKDGAWVLDLCCGRGGPALHLAQHTGCQIVGIDRSPEAIALARAAATRRGLGRLTTFLVADAASPPLGGVFDAVVLYETMLTFAEKAQLLREVHRLLRPGGRFALTLEEGRPLSRAERQRIPDGQNICLIPEDEFLARLDDADLRVRRIEDHTAAHADVARRLAAAFRHDRVSIAATVGAGATDELVAAHERWAEWLGVRRVRKLAFVAERPC
jgi:sarcosine/dimethylglycine N-methyltransferase